MKKEPPLKLNFEYRLAYLNFLKLKPYFMERSNFKVFSNAENLFFFEVIGNSYRLFNILNRKAWYL